MMIAREWFFTFVTKNCLSYSRMDFCRNLRTMNKADHRSGQPLIAGFFGNVGLSPVTCKTALKRKQKPFIMELAQSL